MVDDWQPIATAPKDSTHILILFRWARTRYIAEGWWAPAGHWSTLLNFDVRAYAWAPLPSKPIKV